MLATTFQASLHDFLNIVLLYLWEDQLKKIRIVCLSYSGFCLKDKKEHENSSIVNENISYFPQLEH